jgi:hypothetical protein
MPDFQQTVNLKDSLKPQPRPQPQPAPKPAPAPKAVPKPAPVPAPRRKAEDIDQVYRDEVPETNEFKTIERARPRLDMELVYKRVSLVLALLLVAATGYFLFNRDRPAAMAPDSAGVSAKWYMVKLDNNEVYYGHVQDTTADPIVIKSVYYNYDQLNPAGTEGNDQEAPSASGLRLVKRGKEAQGGDGSMAVVRAHVVSLEPLAGDSKVLKAILNYEQQ